MSVTVSQTVECLCTLKGLSPSFASDQQHRKGSKLNIHFTWITCHSIFKIQQKNLESLCIDLTNPFFNLCHFTRKTSTIY